MGRDCGTPLNVSLRGGGRGEGEDRDGGEKAERRMGDEIPPDTCMFILPLRGWSL